MWIWDWIKSAPLMAALMIHIITKKKKELIPSYLQLQTDTNREWYFFNITFIFIF